MHRRLIPTLFAAALVAGCASSSPKAAPTPSPSGSRQPPLARGIVTAATGTSVTIRERGRRTMTFQITSAVRVRKGKARASSADLRPGDRVAVFGTGPNQVQRIVDRGPAGSASASPTASPTASASPS